MAVLSKSERHFPTIGNKKTEKKRARCGTAKRPKAPSHSLILSFSHSLILSFSDSLILPFSLSPFLPLCLSLFLLLLPAQEKRNRRCKNTSECALKNLARTAGKSSWQWRFTFVRQCGTDCGPQGYPRPARRDRQGGHRQGHTLRKDRRWK